MIVVDKTESEVPKVILDYILRKNWLYEGARESDLTGLKSWVFRFQEILQTKKRKNFSPINPLKSSIYEPLQKIIKKISCVIVIIVLLYRCCGDGPQNVGSGLRLRERKNDYDKKDY